MFNVQNWLDVLPDAVADGEEISSTLRPLVPSGIHAAAAGSSRSTSVTSSTGIFNAVPDKLIESIVGDYFYSIEDFRTSVRLKGLLQRVLSDMEANLIFNISWDTQDNTVRLAAIVRLLVSQLTVPHLFSILGVGLFGSNNSNTGAVSPSSNNGSSTRSSRGSSSASRSSSSSSSASDPSLYRALFQALVEGLSFFRFCEDERRNNNNNNKNKRSDSADSGGDTDSDFDKRRARLVLLLIKVNSSAFLPHEVTVRERAGDILACLSCHMLTITAVTESISSSISLVVERLISTLRSTNNSTATTTTTTINKNKKKSGQMAATQRTIESCAPELEFIIQDYFSWLRENMTQLIKLCRKEEIVHSVDASLRAWLKSEHYPSIGAIVTAYNQKYRHHLTDMPIPLQPFKNVDIRQAIKDLSRESVIVNKKAVFYDPHGQQQQQQTSHADLCEAAIRNELIKITCQIFEHDASFQTAIKALISATPSTTTVTSPSNTTETVENDVRFVLNDGASASAAALTAARAATDEGAALNADLENNQDDQQNIRDRVNRTTPTTTTTGNRSRTTSGQKQSAVAVDLLELMTSYILLAASRTFAAGDAFFILSDLYGGEGLTLCPCDIDMNNSSSNSATNTPNGTPNRKKKSSTATTIATAGATAVGRDLTTTITITATGAKIVLIERYRLFSDKALNQCSDIKQLKPLIHFECTTSTILLFPIIPGGVEERSVPPAFHTIAVSPPQDHSALRRTNITHPGAVTTTHTSNPTTTTTTSTGTTESYHCQSETPPWLQYFNNLVSNPDKLCHRAVSIRPYL